MGTPKRERQKANRQLRLQELAKEARKTKTKRVGLRFAIGIPLFILIVAGIYWLKSDNGASSSPTSSPTTVATTGSTAQETTTTRDPNLPTTTAPITVPGNTMVSATTPCPAADGSSPRTITFAAAPPLCINPSLFYTAVITTNKGEYTVVLNAQSASVTVNNFIVLARYHYYDGTPCQRAIPGYIVQCGDPTGTGAGTPGYVIPDENMVPMSVGWLAMANGGSNTSAAQFLIVTGKDGTALPANYNVFGYVTEGMDTTVKALDAAGNPDKTANGMPTKEQIYIVSVKIIQSNDAPPATTTTSTTTTTTPPTTGAGSGTTTTATP